LTASGNIRDRDAVVTEVPEVAPLTTRNEARYWSRIATFDAPVMGLHVGILL